MYMGRTGLGDGGAVQSTDTSLLGADVPNGVHTVPKVNDQFGGDTAAGSAPRTRAPLVGGDGRNWSVFHGLRLVDACTAAGPAAACLSGLMPPAIFKKNLSSKVTLIFCLYYCLFRRAPSQGSQDLGKNVDALLYFKKSCAGVLKFSAKNIPLALLQAVGLTVYVFGLASLMCGRQLNERNRTVTILTGYFPVLHSMQVRNRQLILVVWDLYIALLGLNYTLPF